MSTLVTHAAPVDLAALSRQVADTERAFAKTMADRDHAAFTRYLADEAVFFGGGGKVLRGKAAVAAAWQGFYQGPTPPFSWEPDSVEVLESGTLAHSSGPVRDPSGKLIARFNSVWRLVSPGVWQIVFDKGTEVCSCAASKDAGQ
ncbi:nuclear transport factor 2 family protein [Chitinimonas sp. BJYL2]|uniref:YybH family protein n=1 Tax=Chitinimonas sp. BJYL2 TaxID=2976696 RepID=UPI0022B4AB07|nr:nuclear transport factor 2 family protein [Chitinimonas sp. BJYL2]